VQANNIQKGMEMAVANPPDLALVDIRLQGENDGFVLCRWLKATLPAVKVIMVTALDNGDTRQEALDAGADDFVNRFMDMSLLLERLENLLKNA
jgi:DNA-binding response OmpR family regulator